MIIISEPQRPCRKTLPKKDAARLLHRRDMSTGASADCSCTYAYHFK
jgi:hypothetical protein